MCELYEGDLLPFMIMIVDYSLNKKKEKCKLWKI